MSLDGYYRGTETKVNTNDKIGRKHTIKDLKEVFDWNLKSNPKKYAIDTLHTDRKGGVDVEEGKWKGLYRDQNPYNFNHFTVDYPTAQFQIRKQKYYEEHHQDVDKRGRIRNSYEPNFEYNSVIRYNVDFTEFFFVDYESYKKRLEKIGCWSPHTVYAVDKYGNQVPEYWMMWELKDIPFYIQVNGIWVRDTTFDDPKVYNDFLEDYREKRKEYLKLQK